MYEDRGVRRLISKHFLLLNYFYCVFKALWPFLVCCFTCIGWEVVLRSGFIKNLCHRSRRKFLYGRAVVLLSALVDCSVFEDWKTKPWIKSKCIQMRWTRRWQKPGISVAADLKQIPDIDKQTLQNQQKWTQPTLSGQWCALGGFGRQMILSIRQIISALRKPCLPWDISGLITMKPASDFRTQQSLLHGVSAQRYWTQVNARNRIGALQQSIDDLDNLTVRRPSFFYIY